MATTAWKPDCIETFTNDYMRGLSDTDLAAKYGGTHDQVKHYVRRIRAKYNLPSRLKLKTNAPLPPETGAINREIQKKFVKFLSKGRTFKEIYNQFEEDSQILLDNTYHGLNLFIQKNYSGDKVYCLLPEIRDEIFIKPRNWSYHQSSSNVSEKNQPYILVNLPDSSFDNENKEVIILPLFDVHYGHTLHKKEEFLNCVDYIENTENVYTFIGGDLIENALDDGRGMSYDQKIPPKTQLDEVTLILSRIAHKTLFCLQGNHEARTYKRAGIDPLYVLSQRLNIPYFDGPVYCTLLGKENRWGIYAMHGYSAAQTKGGKLNAASKPFAWVEGIDLLVSGHVHDCVIDTQAVIREDPVNSCLKYDTIWTVIAPAFLEWENSYAYRAGYRPNSIGKVIIRLNESGNVYAELD